MRESKKPGVRPGAVNCRRATRLGTASIGASIAAAFCASLVFAGSSAATTRRSPVTGQKDLAVSGLTANLPTDVVAAANGRDVFLSTLLGGVSLISTADPSAAEPTQIMNEASGVGSGVFGMALAPDGKTLYLMNLLSNTVLVADVSGSSTDSDDYTVTTRIYDPDEDLELPSGAAVSPDGKTLYIVSTTGIAIADVSGVSTDTDDYEITKAYTLTDLPTLGDSPDQIVLSPNGKMMYVTDEDGPVAVFKVSGTTITPDGTLSDGPEQSLGMTISPDGKTLYVGSQTVSATSGATAPTGVLDALSLVSGKSYGTLLATAAAPTSTVLTGASISPSGKTFYGTWESSNDETDSYLTSATIPPAATKVAVSGKASVGKRLTAKVTKPAGGTVVSTTYAWYSGDNVIKGKTGSAIKLTRAMAGKKVHVKVTASAAAYSSADLTSKATAKVAT